MCSNIFCSTNGLYVEADSKLSAIATFLDELEGDPAAPSLLLAMVDQIRRIIASDADESNADAGALQRALRRLYQAIGDIDTGDAPSADQWERARSEHRRCRAEFSRFAHRICDCGEMPHTTLSAAA